MILEKTIDRVSTLQLEGMTLQSNLSDGIVNLDIPYDEGGNGNGVKPKPLMLSALAGCTAMDVVSLLKKMKIKYRYFEVKVAAELTDEHPKHYSKVDVEYIFKGEDLNTERIQRAVELSFNKYCGVIYMFKQFAEVNYTIQYMD